MQDSLKDYLKICKNTKEDQPKPIKPETLITNEKKKECNAKAMQIVEFAIDGKLRPESFFKCLPHINQSFYQDIVEERALTKLCGYPVCGKKLPQMPKKQFFISTKNNQIYDITERKNFCSNFCYSASIHIRNQIDNSPLWLRTFDQVKEFQLLPKCEKGLPGEKIDQGIAKPVKEETDFTSISQFTHLSLDEMDENEVKPQNKKKKIDRKLAKTVKTMKPIDEEVENEEIRKEIVKKDKIETMKNIVKKSEFVKENQRKLQENKKTIKIIEETINSDKPERKKAEIDIENTIKKCFKEWLTIKSLMYIHGEPKMNDYLKKHNLQHYLESLEVDKLNVEQQKKYLEICRYLHLQQLIEDKFQNSVVPDYEKIKEETRKLDLKVKSFYSGDLLNEDFPMKINENVKEETAEELCLPLIDAKSQIALRRKIFMNSLSKTLENLLEIVRIESREILWEIKEFVKTFKLSANNITFKPVELNYISIVFLKILSLKNSGIEDLLMERGCEEYLEEQLNLLPNKNAIILDIFEMVNNIEEFLLSGIEC